MHYIFCELLFRNVYYHQKNIEYFYAASAEVNEADRMILWAEMDADNTGQVTKDEFEEGKPGIRQRGWWIWEVQVCNITRWNLTRTCLLLNYVFVSYQRWGSWCPLDDHPDLGFFTQEKLDIDFAAAKYAKALAAVQAHGCFFPSGLHFVGFSIYWVVDGLALQGC